jgi:hypothetical protein
VTRPPFFVWFALEKIAYGAICAQIRECRHLCEGGPQVGSICFE